MDHRISSQGKRRTCLIIIFPLAILLLGLKTLPVAGASPNIAVTPAVIDTKVKKITVTGSGFTPGSQITIGFPDVPTHKDLPFAKGMWVSVVKTNQSGAFSVEVGLSRTLWRLGRIVGKKRLPGVYKVMAKNAMGEVATTSLEVKKAKD